jgi:hypothetical protein
MWICHFDILVLVTWPIIFWWAIYLPLCWWHRANPRAPWWPWVPLEQHEPWRRQLEARRVSKSVLAKTRTHNCVGQRLLSGEADMVAMYRNVA